MIKKKYIPKPHQASTIRSKEKVRKETLEEKGNRITQWTVDKLNRAETHEELSR